MDLRKTTSTAVLCMAGWALSISALHIPSVAAQQVNGPPQIEPMGTWLEYRQVRYRGQPILVHLRQGYERAVLMPEAIRLETAGASLPGCEVVVEGSVIGFYPSATFTRRPIRFVGLRTGDTYELRVRASSAGIRQPLQINR